MRRMRKERMEWEAAQSSRFEELDTDDDEDYDDDGVENIRLAPDEAYRDDLMHYPEQSGRYSRRDARYDDHLAYPTDYDYDAEYDENLDYRAFDAGRSGGGDMQLALRQKEEELVDNALRRIRRARIRGDPDVGLSREEIDALERRQLIPRPPDAPARGGQTTALAPVAPKSAKPKKRSGGGFLGFGSATQRPKSARSADRRPTPPVEPRPPASRAPAAEPAYYAGGPFPPPVQQPYGASSGHRSNSSPSKYPSSSRPGSRRQMIEQPPPFALRPPSSSSRGSPTRSLPDDPDWVPRSHSGSPAHHYHHGGGGAPVDPFMYQTASTPQHIQGRRITSGPPTVSYSSLRRAPPTSNPVGRNASGSGLSQEIPISSDESRDEDEEEGDEEDEEESDDGVTLDVSKIDPRTRAQTSRQALPPPPPPAAAAPPQHQRPRRGRR